MNSTEVALIDLSSIAYPIWHVSSSEPDPNHTSQQIVARVRTLAQAHPHAAICCDSGRSFRRDISAEYKANRPERDATLHHQIDLAKEQLTKDGFPIWSAAGFEADDLIATATLKALATPDLSVLIITGDKDLLQLVGPRVRAMSARDGSVLDDDGVGAKFGVKPSQMRDYLTLVGDASDNIKGAKGIGPKNAAELLAKFGSLDSIYHELHESGLARMGLKPAVATSLREFHKQFETTRKLVTLRTDVELPFEQISVERVAKATEEFEPEADEDFAVDGAMDGPDAPEEPVREEPPTQRPILVHGSAPAVVTTPKVDLEQGMAIRQPDFISPAPKEWERQLDPRSMQEVRVIAKDLFNSRMFAGAYGTPQGVLSTIMLGRELGLPTMASLRQIHIIEGRHALSASLMVALVLKSGFAEFFEPVSFDEQQATFTTHRRGARTPVTLQHTIEMAKTAGLLKDKSNWLKIPGDMVVARAQSRLCRMIYPDIIGGLYTPDEIAEIREREQVA